jgi:hypothetical protein
VAIGLALLLAPAAAQARSEVLQLPRGFDPLGDPDAALVGDHVVYSDPLASSRVRLRLAGPGGEDRPLTSFGPPGARRVEIVGSQSLVAVRRDSDLFTGPAAGPLTNISHCASSTPKLDADNVAFPEAECGGDPVLVVQSTERHVIALPPGTHADRLSLAGPYIAYRLARADGKHEIVVQNWQTGADAMRVPVESERECGTSTRDGKPTDSFCSMAVQSDGTVVELIGQFVFHPAGRTRYEEEYTDDTCGGTINWRSLADPQPHPISAHGCATEPLRIASGRVLFADRPVVGIAVVDLQGNERRLGSPNQVYAFDGTNVFVNEETCIAGSIVSSSVLGDDPLLAFTRAESSTCPMRFRDARLTLGRHPRLTMTLTCRIGCLGPVVAGTDRYADAASPDFTLQPGKTRKVEIKLSRHSRLVRLARGWKQVRVALNTFDINFNPTRASALYEASRNPAEHHVKARVRGR